jgi:hypothetical protein
MVVLRCPCALDPELFSWTSQAAGPVPVDGGVAYRCAETPEPVPEGATLYPNYGAARAACGPGLASLPVLAGSEPCAAQIADLEAQAGEDPEKL